MLELVGFYSFALFFNLADRPLSSVQLNPSWDLVEIVRELPWQQAEAEPYETPYEREVNGKHDDGEADFEEMRRRDYEEYEERSQEYGDNDYERSDRYGDVRSSEYHNQREILEERKREIEEQIEELDRRYGY